MLREISEKVRVNLKKYDFNVETRYRLLNIKSLLEDEDLISRIESLNPFDISIIEKIIANIKDLINNY